ncbi:hypothetical protein ABGB18_11065 [Nonomuraea sp. B12E4]|uniref:hypothetical protein n=1 Tax=Nonomuraea sp. B12E4 TaxID=3153564 RepID=UPI00325CBEF8
MPDLSEEVVQAAWAPIAAHPIRWQYVSEEDVREILEAAAPVLAAQARADERRKVSREIAKEILRQKPSGNTQVTWEGGIRRAARVARQIGEDL